MARPTFSTFISALPAALLTLAVGCGGGNQETNPMSGTPGGGSGNTGTGTAPSPLPPTLTGSVANAVTTGNALVAGSADNLIASTLATIEYQRTAMDGIVTSLYNLDAKGAMRGDGTSITALSWDPRHDCALLGATFGVNKEVIVATENSSGDPVPPSGLAVAGKMANGSRYLAMGTNPFRIDPNRNNSSTVNAQMDQFMVNALSWLSGKPKGSPLKVALAHLDESYWFADESSTRTWLETRLGAPVTTHAARLYDGSNLGQILTDGADLVILSQRYDSTKDDPGAIAATVKALMDAGKPVLYLDSGGGPNALGSQLYQLFQIIYQGDNHWSHLRTSNLNGMTLLGSLGASWVGIREMLTRLKSGDYDFPLTDHSSTTALSAAYNAQFQDGASAVRNMMASFDAAAKDIFKKDGLYVHKLLALIGDSLRQEIVYPMGPDKSTPKTFLRAYYADHSVYNTRSINPAQKDLGSFSTKDLSKIVPVNRTVKMTSGSPFRAAGVYALPGKPVKVTRLDVSGTSIQVFVNSLRSGSTHEWDNGGYTRPKFLRSAPITIAPGQSLTFTSPYGGPIQLGFGTDGLPVEVAFENVGLHAFWRSSEDDERFALALSAAEFDWAEIQAESFEIHSKLDRLKTASMVGLNWSTPQTLAAAAMKYDHSQTRALAGMKGDGIEVIPEIQGWATTKGFVVASYNNSQHMNADQATCGSLCSGNPYDSWGAFKPIGHGNLHEIGHGLQSGRMLFSTGTVQQGGHGATNFYSTYVRTRFYEDTGLHDPGDGSGITGMIGTPASTPDPIFSALVGCAASADPGLAMERVMQNALTGATPDPNDHQFDVDSATATALSNFSYDYNYRVFEQMQMQAVKRGQLTVGHHLIGRLHVMERTFNNALKDATTWEAQKGALGFGTLTLEQARALPNNDWLVIACSVATGIDYRSLLDMMGCRFSSLASAQVATFGYPSTGKEYMMSNHLNAAMFKGSRAHTEYGKAIQIKTILISPNTPWPW